MINYIDLTKNDLDKMYPENSYKREDNEIPILTPREIAILRHVWRLHREEKDLCSTLFINKCRVSKFLDLTTYDTRFNERVKVGKYDLITNYMDGNREYYRSLLENEERKEDFWVLISARVNYKSNFYQCLIRKTWELSETEEGYLEL